MIRSEKKLNDIALLLNKGDETAIIAAIELLREEEPFEGIIGLLADYYDRNSNRAIARAIENLMNDIKNPSLQPEIINEIKKERKSSTKSMLVSSCWQSGLDYSAFLIDFAGIFLDNDYSVGIECLTVIEEASATISSGKKTEIINMIDNHPFSPNDEKSSLAGELKSILEK
ncbi:MAG TPA: hypothetical protein VK213_13345 [Bacteroidales bacterium]|nr:hypothetical protein [Bacteroidales bacterium]